MPLKSHVLEALSEIVLATPPSMNLGTGSPSVAFPMVLNGASEPITSNATGAVWVFGFGSFSTSTMIVQDLETGRRELLGPGTSPFYSPSGHLVYQPSVYAYDLWALPFSLDTLKATGEAFPIAQKGFDPTVSADGTLVYLHAARERQRQLAWRDRRGEKAGEIGPPQDGDP